MKLFQTLLFHAAWIVLCCQGLDVFAAGGRESMALSRSEFGSPKLISIKSFEAEDDRALLQKALEHMKTIQGPSILRLEPRSYHIKGVPKSLGGGVLEIEGLNKVRIEGCGATLVASDQLNTETGALIQFKKFDGLEIVDLNITYDPLPFIQGQMVKVDQGAGRVDVILDSIFDDVMALMQSPNSEFWCRVGRLVSPHRPKPLNPSWMKVQPLDNGYLVSENQLKEHSKNRLLDMNKKEQVFRFKAGKISMDDLIGGEENWQKGEPLVIWKRGAQDAVVFEEGKHLMLHGIKVDSALHYAIKLRGVRGGLIQSCAIVPRDRGMISSSADGIDLQQCVDIQILNNRIVSTGDDGISLLNHGHGHNGMHHEKKFGSSYPETNLNVDIIGNEILGGNRNGMLLLVDGVRVENNTVMDLRQYAVKFSGDQVEITNNRFIECGHFIRYRHILDELATGIVGSDQWYQQNISIRNNLFKDWYHMPAILLRSVGTALVEENQFLQTESKLEQRIDLKHFPPYSLGEMGHQPVLGPELVYMTHGVFRGQIIKNGGVEIGP